MSTPSSDEGSPTESARSPGASDSLAGPDSPAVALAVQTGAFTDAFGRWASRRATEAGASVPRLRLLYTVLCHGPQKMADLADALTVTPRNVTALVDGLEGEGLVRRVPHSTDRRVTLVELTCNRELVAAQFETYQGSIERLFDVLTVEDQRTLLRLLETLHDRMHAEAGCSIASTETPDA
jgi:DNA-binding MarR family transcriptional regulator